MCTSTSLDSNCITSSVATQLVDTGDVLLVQLLEAGAAGGGEAADPRGVGIGDDPSDGLALSIGRDAGAGGASAGTTVSVSSIM